MKSLSKKLTIVFFTLLFKFSLIGGNVDSIIERIQSTRDFSVKDWLFTKERIEDPRITDFSGWKPCKFGENFEGKYVWLRGEGKTFRKISWLRNQWEENLFKPNC